MRVLGSASRRAGLAAVIAVAAALTLAPPAAAHAGLESSDPASGEVLPTAPSAITLSFTEPPDLDLSSVSVLDAAGSTVETGPVEEGPPPRSLRVSLPADLGDGVYTVSWRVVSTADGHPTAGALAFGVGATHGEVVATPDASEPATPAPSPLAVAGKLLLYAGLAIAVGCSVTSLIAFAGELPPGRLLLPAAGAAALVGAIAMTVAEAGVVDASVGDLLSSATGRSYLWLLATAAITLVAAVVASRRPVRASLVALGVAAAATMLVRATSGHAAALVPAWPAELAQFVHFLAIGVWVGGLVALFALLRRWRRRSEHEHAEPQVDAVRRFSRLAGWAVLVVVATGASRTVGEAGGVGEVRTMLFETAYGTTLMLKVGLALVLIGLGALNRARSIPRLATDGTLLRQVVSIELVVALGVFGLTGTLTSLNPDPPTDPDRAPAPTAATATGADFATTTRVTLTATPGTAGPNTFEAHVVDYDEGTPLPADEVALRMAPIGRPEIEASTIELDPVGGHWMGAGTQLSLAGAWDVVVQVRSGARTTEVPLVLVTRAPPTTSVVAQGSDDLPDIETFTLSTGEQIQLYLDPGVAGANEYHVTAFAPDGQELPLSGVVVVAVDPDGAAEVLDPTRLTPGHFALPLEADPGEWTFQVVATTEGGTVLQATQAQEVAA